MQEQRLRKAFLTKLEQILPWQDGQYAEVFLGIRDYDVISEKMSDEERDKSDLSSGNPYPQAPKRAGDGMPCEEG